MPCFLIVHIHSFPTLPLMFQYPPFLLQGKYCPFCFQVYRERDPDEFDNKQVRREVSECMDGRANEWWVGG